MEKQSPASKEFSLKMNPMVKNLLLTTLGTCKFAMLHKDHALSHAIRQFKLFDNYELNTFIEAVRETSDNEDLFLDLNDEIMIYTAMDITCKAYLTDLADEMEALNKPRIKSTNSSFESIRNTVIKGCQFVMDGMKEQLMTYPEFEDRVDILENYIIV